jgi:hypothetical protein
VRFNTPRVVSRRFRQHSNCNRQFNFIIIFFFQMKSIKITKKKYKNKDNQTILDENIYYVNSKKKKKSEKKGY